MSQDELKPEDFIESVGAAVKACESADPRQAAGILAEAGLLGIIVPESIGGLGLELPFAVPVVTQAARGLLPFPLVETMLTARHLAEPFPEVAAALASGTVLATVGWHADLVATETGSGYRISGSIAAAPMAQFADYMLAPLNDDRAVFIDMKATGVTIAPSMEFDVTAPEAELQLEGCAAQVIDDGLWNGFTEDAFVLQSAAILGCAEAAFERAREHAVTRRQFQRILAHNQAVRHLLSRSEVALEGLRASVRRAASADEPFIRRSAFMASVAAGPMVVETAIQIHGGMGYTWELPLHRYLRRVRAIEMQVSPHRVADSIAADLVARAAAERGAALHQVQ